MRLRERVQSLPDDFFLGGPRKDFEAVGRMQMIMLLMLGMYPESKVLDIGCGCLRGGYWLLHFLEPGCYFGLERHQEVVDGGIRELIEPELIELKKPRFAYNDAFDSSVFNEKFDFFFARSVWTHVSKTQIEIMLDAFARDAADDGVFLTSYHPAGFHSRFFQSVPSWILSGFRRPEYMGEEYVNAAFHGLGWIQAQCASRGLVAEDLKPGFYNTQQWLMITKQSRANSHDLWERSEAARLLQESFS